MKAPERVWLSNGILHKHLPQIAREFEGTVEYRRVRECVWQWVQMWGYEVSNYETSCGESIERRDGSYCPYCSRPIRIVEDKNDTNRNS